MTVNPERLRELRAAKRLSQAHLARLAGVSQQLITALEAGKVESSRKIGLIAGALGISPSDLDPDFMGTPVPQRGDVSIAFKRMRGEGRLPIFGQAIGGTDGRFIFNGERIGDIPIPSSLVSVPNAYAVYASGTSMEPRYFAGEVLHVNPVRPARAGDHVVIQIAAKIDGDPPEGFVKRLVSRDNKRVVVEQYNPSRKMEFPTRDVMSVHVIVGTGED